MEKNEIIKIYGTDYKEMTKCILEKADLADEIPKDDALIGIKPNLVSPMEASWGGTTHPEVVAGIIEYLQEHGFKKIVMLEGSWVGDKTSESVKVCGYDTISEKYHVPFWDLQKDTASEVDCSGMKLLICDKAQKIDFLINVPVLKGHCQTKITCALKNMKGLIPNKEKRHFHSMGLHKPIGHLAVGIHQDFIVVDHICGDLDFEDGGHPVVRNCIMAAKDPVLVDSYTCHLLHYDTAEVPYIGIAESLGVGCSNLEKMKLTILGNEEENELPRSDKIVELKDAVQEVDSCSACYGYLIPALDMLREEGLFEKFKEFLGKDKIAIGQGYRGKCGRIGIGQCTKDFEINVPGCPPTEKEIYEVLKRFIQSL